METNVQDNVSIQTSPAPARERFTFIERALFVLSAIIAWGAYLFWAMFMFVISGMAADSGWPPSFSMITTVIVLNLLPLLFMIAFTWRAFSTKRIFLMLLSPLITGFIFYGILTVVMSVI